MNMEMKKYQLSGYCYYLRMILASEIVPVQKVIIYNKN